MPLRFDASHVIGPKIQALQSQNLRLQERVQELETKNAILNLRLAQSQGEEQKFRESIVRFKITSERETEHRNHLAASTQEVSERVKEIKNDLKTVEEDVSHMFNDVKQMFESHLGELMNRFEKVKIKDKNISELDNRVEELENALIKANERHIREKKRRRKLHNTLIELRGNIRVHCRLRPLMSFDNGSFSPLEVINCKYDRADETELGKPGTPSEQVILPIDEENITVTSLKPGSNPKYFEFEHVYFPGDAQDMIFEEVQPLITSLLDGYNVCIMAYGQTGSGKTHTMLGTNKEPGIVPKAGEELFKLIDEKPAGSVSVQVSVVEVYNNEIYDLLSDNPKETKHEITTTEEGSLDTTSTIQIQVHNSNEVEKWMEHGLKHRAMIATKVHEHSSRSHLVVTLTVTSHKIILASPRKPSDGDSDVSQSPTRFSLLKTRRQLPQTNLPMMTNSSPRKSSSSDEGGMRTPMTLAGDSFKTKLQLVDLAGSECVGMSGVTGSALRETSHINRSLSALSDVLGALSEKRSHVPYRNSRLTRLLQDSIGGDAKLLIMLCVSPAHRYLTESLQCLSFGQRARQVQRGPAKKRGHYGFESPIRPMSPREKPSSVRKMQF